METNMNGKEPIGEVKAKYKGYAKRISAVAQACLPAAKIASQEAPAVAVLGLIFAAACLNRATGCGDDVFEEAIDIIRDQMKLQKHNERLS